MKKGQLFVVAAIVIVVALFAGASYYYKANEEKKTEAVVAEAQGVLIRPDSPSFGPESARVTIVEFLDPECESCRAMHPHVKKVMKEYDGKVRLVVRYMPLHSNSLYVSSALEEARELGKFEQALDTLFEKQPEWGSHHEPRPDLIPKILQSVGLPEKATDRVYVLGKHGSKIERDYSDGMRLGVRGTPTFFVNGKMLPALGYDALKSAVDLELTK